MTKMLVTFGNLSVKLPFLILSKIIFRKLKGKANFRQKEENTVNTKFLLMMQENV